MLKPLHFVTGLGALLLALILSFSQQQFQPFALLACLGLFHLFIAPLLPSATSSSSPRQASLVSLLLIAAAIVAATAALQPESSYEIASLVVLSVATLLHLLSQRLPQASQAQAHSNSPNDSFTATPDSGQRETGIVKWFNTTKGFGFISRANGDDIFVHFRAIRGDGHRILVEGQHVEYSVIAREKGLQAEDVVEILDN